MFEINLIPTPFFFFFFFFLKILMSVHTILAPSTIGSYTFKKTIGEGAFSVVKLCFHEELKQFFACKIVPRSSLLEHDLNNRFEIEIRINQQLHHPGIVQVVDLLKDQLNNLQTEKNELLIGVKARIQIIDILKRDISRMSFEEQLQIVDQKKEIFFLKK